MVHINKTKGNVHCVVTSMFGKRKTLWSVSGGRVGRQGSRRKTRYTQRVLYGAAIEKILGLGFQYLVLHCRGAIASKRYILRAFSEKFTVLVVKDLTNIAHNGSKPANRRRV